MADDFRHARGARGQHQPFGRALGLAAWRPQRSGGPAGTTSLTPIRPSLRMVGDDGIDLGILDQALR
jgi:hypothetical protein